MYTRKPVEQQADIGADHLVAFPAINNRNMLTDSAERITFALIKKGSNTENPGFIPFLVLF